MTRFNSNLFGEPYKTEVLYIAHLRTVYASRLDAEVFPMSAFVKTRALASTLILGGASGRRLSGLKAV
jgi:hypothetical protein